MAELFTVKIDQIFVYSSPAIVYTNNNTIGTLVKNTSFSGTRLGHGTGLGSSAEWIRIESIITDNTLYKTYEGKYVHIIKSSDGSYYNMAVAETSTRSKFCSSAICIASRNE